MIDRALIDRLMKLAKDPDAPAPWTGQTVTPPADPIHKTVAADPLKADQLGTHVISSLNAGEHYSTQPGWDAFKEVPNNVALADQVVRNHVKELGAWRLDPKFREANKPEDVQLAARNEQALYERLMKGKSADQWKNFQFPKQLDEKTNVMQGMDKQLADVAAALEGSALGVADQQRALDQVRGARGLNATVEDTWQRSLGGLVQSQDALNARATAAASEKAPEAAQEYADKIAGQVAELRTGAQQAASGNAQSLWDWFSSSWTNWLVPAGLLVGLFGGNKWLQLAGVAAAGYGGYRLYDMTRQLNSPRGKAIATDVFSHLGQTKDAKLTQDFLLGLDQKYGEGASYIARTAAALPAVGYHATIAGMIEQQGATTARNLNPLHGYNAYQQALATKKLPTVQPGVLDKLDKWWAETGKPTVPKPAAATQADSP